jgi:hypothetical protein
MDHDNESAIAALRSTGLHRCTTAAGQPERLDCPRCSGDCNHGRSCPVHQACEVPDPGSELRDPANAIVYAATLAVALLGVAAALFS